VSYKARAISAIRNTRQTLENWGRVGRGDFSLAHGLAGNAEVLLYAHEVLGGELEAVHSLAVQVAREAGMNCAMGGYNSQWGAAVEETPSLMSGLAGIGYFYLRLRDPRILSTLTWIQRARDFDCRFRPPSRLAQTTSHPAIS
jgi:lantibiotic modifying enzyme